MGDKGRPGMARLADGQIQHVSAPRMGVEKTAKARPHVFRQVRKPLGENHLCLNVGVMSPRFGKR